MIDVDIATHHALVCALWVGTVDDGEPMDEHFTIMDVTPATRANLLTDMALFIAENAGDLALSGLDAAQIGHDFILTRNGHGTGFWDRGLVADLGDRLTDACRPYGEFDLYVGDDGRLYSM